MNRLKNGIILIVLIGFLIIILTVPVTCIFKSVTGILCPACGMTRAFSAILRFDFLSALYLNILSIPLFIFIIYFIIRLFIDFLKNDYIFIPNLINFFDKYYIMFLFLIFISFIFNNLKT